MLKATEYPPAGTTADSSIGELASQLVDDAKAYAMAEADVAKAMAAEKANAVKVPLIMIVAAVFVAMGALNALCVAIFFGFNTLMSPVLAGIAAFVLIGAIAGIIGWIGIGKLRSAL